ncbi:MAG: hypothetical protein WBQ44_13825 [Rhodococcus sp. (in: high G+C Gram-positive bacteria)]
MTADSLDRTAPAHMLAEPTGFDATGFDTTGPTAGGVGATEPPAALPLLIELPSVRFLLDVLGALALFTTAAISLSTRDAVFVTITVGIFVLAARAARYVRRD